MSNEKTTTFSNGLIWFGAAVSIAEILTGALIAPLGFWRGMAAVLIGHVIGCVLLYFAGIIGANTHKSSMETVKISFGQKGSLIFSVSNMLQLTGWTAVMIVSGLRLQIPSWDWETMGLEHNHLSADCRVGHGWAKQFRQINTIAMSALFCSYTCAQLYHLLPQYSG
jgi:purine-cytosine permease-like protein